MLAVGVVRFEVENMLAVGVGVGFEVGVIFAVGVTGGVCEIMAFNKKNKKILSVR
jgi:hypothetical protein